MSWKINARVAHEGRRITLAQMEGFLAGWRELRGVTLEQHAKRVASGTPLARAFSCGSLRSPYKSELARRLEISKIASLNLNLFLVTLEAGEAGVPKGSCPFKRMKSRSASEGSLTCALCISQFHLRPGPPPGWPPGISIFFALDGKFPGVGTLELSNPPGWWRKKRANAPSSVNTATFFIDRTVK